MPSTLPSGAKTNVAAVAAVVMAGVTAWQIATRDGFTWWDLIPVVAAVAGVAVTDHVDNTIGSPAAKAVVHGALSALAAVAAALAAVVGPEPSGVSATKLVVAGLGTAAVWYYPEFAPAAADASRAVAAGAPVAQILTTVAGDVAASMGPDLPPLPVAAGPVEPTPLGDAAATAAALAHAVTSPQPAVTA